MNFRVSCLALLLIGPIGACPQIAEAQGLPAQAPAPVVLRTAPRTTLVNVLVQGPTDVRGADTGRLVADPILRVGWDYAVRLGDTVRDVTVVSGDLTVDGTVRGDVVVVFGTARLSSTADVTGSLVVVGGSATIASGARVARDMIVAASALDAPQDFSPGGQYIAIGLPAIGERVRSVIPWITHGLLLGRLIVPSLRWVWWVVAGFFLVYFALNLVFGQAAGACAAMLTRRPFSAFLAGLLTLLLTGPISVILAVSVVGLAVIPFFICALLIAWTIGKVAVARRIGSGLVRETDSESRFQSVRSFTIGFGVVTLAYMVPLLGFVAWTMIGVFGLGAAVLTFFSAFRQEVPAAPPRPAAPVMPLVNVPVSAAAPIVEPAPPGSSEPAVPRAPISGSLLAFPHAPFLDRLAAFVLDVLLALLVVRLMSAYPDNVLAPLLFGYFVLFWTWKGTTVGGLICQLRVVRTDGAPLRPVDSVVRALSSLFSFAVFGLGCLWMIRDAERQTWHDKIAGTYVIKVPNDWPL